MPLEEYIENENLHSLVKEHVLSITRNFDHRVHSFIKHIVMGKMSPFNVEYYHYRVEFQMRGAGHVHGVLWLKMNEIETDFEGINQVISNLRKEETLNEGEKSIMTRFIDTFISCSLNDNSVKDIV